MAVSIIGQTVTHYRIVEKIGEGGMGVVYRASDTRLGRQVALKFLPPRLAADPIAVERFQREARAASALNHPHICAIYDVGRHEDLPFLVMELLEGRTLRHRIGSQPLPTDTLLDFGVQAADALESAHVHSIVHRDIKSSNMFVADNGQLKILDFGLAKLANPGGVLLDSAMDTTSDANAAELTASNQILGTTTSMSPEQIRGDEVDSRSDLFSFGVVLYEMATGREPFTGRTPAMVLNAILHDTPQPASAVNPRVPLELDRIIAKALSKERDQRYQTAATLREDLVRLKSQPDAAGSGTVTPGGSTPDRLSPRRRRLLAIAALTAVVLSAGAAYQLWLREPGRTSNGSDSGTAASLDSVAVLPFVATGSGVEPDYLADGITEALIHELAKVSGLRVAARSVVFRYKGRRDAEARQIGRDLNVASIVTGRVTIREGRILIGVELIGVETGTQVWSRNYERPAADLLEVQDEVATEVGGRLALGARLGAKAKKKLAATGLTKDPAAYQLYLQGRYHSNKGTIPDNKTAIECFQRAIQKDPRFALAHAALAESYLTMVAYWADPILSAKSAVDEALRIEPDLAEAHVALGDIKAWLYWDWTTAQRELERAIVLNPDSALAHSRYAMVLATIGRVPDAIAEIKQAQDLDPLSASINSDFGWHLLNFGRYIDAVAQFQKAIGLDAESVSAHHGLGIACSLIGRHEQAVTELKHALQLSENSPVVMGHLGAAYARQRRPADAQRVLRDLQNLSLREYVPSSAIAMVYEAMGDRTRALDWLDKAIDEHDFSMAQLSIAPWFRSLHDDARFEKLLVKLNLSRPDRAKDAL